jgi:hypothetical protein
MKIKLLVSVAGLDFSYAAGEIVDAPQHIAEDMLRAQYAVSAEEESEDDKPKRGRPKKLD